MLKIDAEMPKSCWACEIGPADQVPNCPFYKLPGEEQRKEEYKTGRHPDCPITEIIRCKECKNKSERIKISGEIVYCTYRGRHVASADFCNHGERKDGDTDETD